MHNLIKASLFKLFRDRTFIVTAIIGVIIAFFMIGASALSKFLSDGIDFITGESSFLTALTPGNSFGLTIPINLVVFTVGEFTYGTVRNKIIAGLSKAKVYFGLFITGLVFTFILAAGYALITIGLTSAITGFNPDNIGGVKFIFFYIANTILTYTFVTAVSVFFASLIRNIGGSITVSVISMVFLSFLPFIIMMIELSNGNYSIEHWSCWLNPLYVIGIFGNNVSTLFSSSIGSSLGVGSIFDISNTFIAAGIVTPTYWAIIFFVLGLFVFKRSDVK